MKTSSEPIAIVGLAGRFPGAGADLERFWDAVATGRDCATEVPQGRWTLPPERCTDPRVAHPDHVYSTRGYFLDPFQPDLEGLKIDAGLVQQLDVLFQLVLDVGNRAWKAAKTAAIDRRKVGVVLGNICLPTEQSNAICREVLGGDWGLSRGALPHRLNRYVAGLPAGLLAKSLSLGGGTFTLDAACASTLYALKLAADALRTGRADAMLAGGCNRADSQYTQMGFAQLRALSVSGRCAPFDAAADGLMVGEGAGIFVLKRLSDALKDDDHIHGVLCGWGLSNDIGANLLSPAVEGQLRAMRAAYDRAQWQPSDVDLIECHATGTPVGDAIEFESLCRLWGDAPRPRDGCVIGSVKSTVGHLLTGAGAAAVTKVLLAMARDQRPPQTNFHSPATTLRLETSPFRILEQAEPWAPRKAGQPQRAAVSGFGFGGVNAHLLFEQYVGQEYKRATTTTPIGPISSSLSALKERLAKYIEESNDESKPVQRPATVAIVGLAGHYGPWGDARALQEYLLGGGQAHAPRPKKTGWEHDPEASPPGQPIEELQVPLERFRIPPKELEEMLPQQLLMLQVASRALDDADSPVTQEDPRTGVFIGLGLDPNTTNYHLLWAVLGQNPGDNQATAAADAASPALTANRVMGALGSIAASRIARAFQFGGPSFTVCSEEASAGPALELAVRALQNKEIDRALVGGVELTADARTQAMLPPGSTYCEGAGALVLKRLEDAERDGNRVYAVIEGVGSANGGVPEIQGPDASALATSLIRACSDAAISPDVLQYLELASGSLPDVDSAEASALAALFKATSRTTPLTMGCVHKELGATGAASGMVGILRTALALYQEILPAASFDLSGDLQALAAKCHLRQQPCYWLTNADGPRRAAVAIAGGEGSSVHLVLREGSQHAKPVERRQPLGAREEALFACTGGDAQQLLHKLEQLQEHIGQDAGSIEYWARTWFQSQPASAGDRLAVVLVARSVDELRVQLETVREHLQQQPAEALPREHMPEMRAELRDRVFYSPEPIGADSGLAFVFPGSGNQFAGMGRDLGVQWPEILRTQQAENLTLRDQYAPHLFWREQLPEETTPRDALFGQVTHGTLVGDLLRHLGLRPRAMLGLSLGESAGLFGMRAWTARDEMYRRILTSTLFQSDLAPPYNAARSCYGLPADATIDWVTGVLAAPAEDVLPHLRPNLRSYLQIITTPAECVIGGLREDVDKLLAVVKAPFFPLQGVTLAHCEAGKPVEVPYRELHRLPVTPQESLKVYSAAWGREYRLNEWNAADSITAGLVGTIDFPAIVHAAYEDGIRIFVEVGPGNSSTRMIAAILGDSPYKAWAVTPARQDATGQVLRLLAMLIAERYPVDLQALYGEETRCVGHRLPESPTGRVLTLPVGRRAMPATAPAEPAVPPALPEVRPAPSAPPPRVEAPVEVRPPSPALHAPVAEPAHIQPGVRRPQYQPMDVTPFVQAVQATQQSAAAAHEVFLRVQNGLTQTAVQALQLQTQLLSQAMHRPKAAPGDLPSAPMPAARSVPAPAVVPGDGVPRALDMAACFAFARGKIADVLGPTFAEVDQFPTRVRLPDGPLMLVDRIHSIEGEPRSLTRGRLVTEHLVHAERWYLDAERCPTSVTVEAGQADLFLSGFLGIDFRTRGLAVYRLLDAVVTFHRGLPRIGERIEYDIHIDEFSQQADSWLFRFRFEGTINGEPLLSMQNGVAGFFTPAALEAGQGIVHTKLDLQPMPGKRPADWQGFLPPVQTSLDREQVEALRQGDLVRAFGPAFAPLPMQQPLPLPGGMLRLVDRVPRLDTEGGRFGLGFVRAEYDIQPKEWFIECHFVDDKVMPGTLMYECCLHTLRILLMRMGFVGEAGEVVCEPVPGVNSRLKCRGQVLETTSTVAYEVSIKEIGFRPEPYCIADALMYSDGKPIVEITNMSLRMSGLTREKLEGLWQRAQQDPDAPIELVPARSAVPPEQKPALYDHARIMAYSNGNPSEAFGEPYRIFDRDRVIARLPGPPFQFLDRITDVHGEPFVMAAGAWCEAQYDVPPDAWYFTANRSRLMPFSVLLETALQPCGWLAAYCGSALTSPEDLSFRNLGGEAIQYKPITPDAGTLITTAKMTKVSSSAGMIIQHYDLHVQQRGETVYKGTTYFGFFAKEALQNQVGMPTAKVPFLTADQQAFADQGYLPHESPFPDHQMRMIDRIVGYLPHGGAKSLGLVQGTITVDPSFWFFKAHFYQDPVWPGSLGLESFLQLLKYVAWRKWGEPTGQEWQTVALNQLHRWVYRGQVLPKDREVTVVLEITDQDLATRRLTADGFLVVDGRIIYQMTGFTLEYL